MIFAVNSLLYLNQSVPPYGVSLNCLTTGTTVFPLRKLACLSSSSWLSVLCLAPCGMGLWGLWRGSSLGRA